MTSLELQQTSSRGDGIEQVPGTKADIDLIESAGHGRAATYEESVAARLPKAHRDFLLERHGTLELDPIPGMSAADPYNWPSWKVSLTPRKSRADFTQTQVTSLGRVLMHEGLENDEPYPCGVPRLHGHIYRRCHHSRLF
jgi:hypothetical protein